MGYDDMMPSAKLPSESPESLTWKTTFLYQQLVFHFHVGESECIYSNYCRFLLLAKYGGRQCCMTIQESSTQRT